MKITFGKLNSDGSKAVYLRKNNQEEKVFCFWYHVKNDNPFEIRPTDAVIDIIFKAGYMSLHEFYDKKKYENRF